MRPEIPSHDCGLIASRRIVAGMLWSCRSGHGDYFQIPTRSPILDAQTQSPAIVMGPPLCHQHGTSSGRTVW
jgi:hypothetical protein